MNNQDLTNNDDRGHQVTSDAASNAYQRCGHKPGTCTCYEIIIDGYCFTCDDRSRDLRDVFAAAMLTKLRMAPVVHDKNNSKSLGTLMTETDDDAEDKRVKAEEAEEKGDELLEMELDNDLVDGSDQNSKVPTAIAPLTSEDEDEEPVDCRYLRKSKKSTIVTESSSESEPSSEVESTPDKKYITERTSERRNPTATTTHPERLYHAMEPEEWYTDKYQKEVDQIEKGKKGRQARFNRGMRFSGDNIAIGSGTNVTSGSLDAVEESDKDMAVDDGSCSDEDYHPSRYE